MISLENRMIQYLKVQGCALSTIKTYSDVLRLILKSHSGFENYNSQKLIEVIGEPKAVEYGHKYTLLPVYKPSPKSQLKVKSKFCKFKIKIIR